METKALTPSAASHHPRREMAVLGLLETLLSFAAIYAMIRVAAASATFPSTFGVLPRNDFGLAVILTIVAGVAGLAIGLYRTDTRLSRQRLLITTSLAACIAFGILLVVSGAGVRAGQALSIALLLGAWLATLILVRLTYGPATERMFRARRILLVGEPRRIGAVNARLRSRRGQRFDPVLNHAADMSWALLRQQRIWGVVLTSEPEDPAIVPLLDCKLRGVKVLSGAAFNEKYLGRIDLDTLSANDLLFDQGFAVSRFDDAVKRLNDVVVGLAMLVLAVPLMALTALAIKIDSPGPVLYRQQRIGRYNEPFTLFKFRSMRVDAEAGGPRWAQQHDSRITRIGGFIRMTRIDELPQLANVIMGEMSLVGPRPERPHFVEQLARVIPFYRQRAYVKPGLSGSAQINFPYGTSVEDAREKLAYDLFYVKNRSVFLDTIILLSTIRVVLFREGAR
jgi:exopolysaccharide biosynthesis polyprenyl glycosylphosphotransferase